MEIFQRSMLGKAQPVRIACSSRVWTALRELSADSLAMVNDGGTGILTMSLPEETSRWPADT